MLSIINSALDTNYSLFSHFINPKKNIEKALKKINKKPLDNINLKETILTHSTKVNNEYIEGGKTKVKLNKYERNSKARKICINHFGYNCYICGISLEEEYGEIAEGFIHVHHIKPISEIGDNYMVDPIKDLVPICPNCHSIIHKKNPPVTIEEMRKIIIKK